jgi:hypothetical protein
MAINIGKNSSKSRLFRFSVIALQIAFVLVIAITINKIQTNKKHPATAESVTTPSYTVKVDGVTQYPANTTTQLHRVSITISITNSGENVIQISPGLQMVLTDNTNTSHPMTADYLQPGHVIGGPLNPGQTWTEPVDFDLSSQETPSTFVYSVDNSSTPVEIVVPQ